MFGVDTEFMWFWLSFILCRLLGLQPQAQPQALFCGNILPCETPRFSFPVLKPSASLSLSVSSFTTSAKNMSLWGPQEKVSVILPRVMFRRSNLSQTMELIALDAEHDTAMPTTR